MEIIGGWKKVEAGSIHKVSYDIKEGESSTYALVFDNTFSATLSKRVFFIFSTFSTNIGDNWKPEKLDSL